MEPATALGVAAAATQFFDIARNLVKQYQDSRQPPVSQAAFKKAAVDLQKLSSTFKERPKPPRENTNSVHEHQKALDKLIVDCDKTTEELIELLNKVQPEEKGSAWASIGQAIASVWNADKIKSLEERVGTYQNELTLRLLAYMEAKQGSTSFDDDDSLPELMRSDSRIMDMIHTSNTDTLDEAKEHHSSVLSRLPFVGNQRSSSMPEVNQRAAGEEMPEALAACLLPLPRPDSIRLLELRPAADDHAPLVGGLVVTDLEEMISDISIRYTALSYAWGDPAPVGSLALDGLGLRSMVHSNKFAVHWGSTRAPAPSHRDSGLGLELSPIFSRDSLASIESSSSSMSEGDQSSELDTIQHAVQELCSYDWFTRGWVFQELVLSADPRIQCGRMLARWSDVAEVAQEETITDRMTRTDEAKINVLLEMDRAAGGKGENKLTTLIRARTGSHVSDPRDFFYCLMGIANDRREWEDIVRTDYNVSVRSLYVSVAHCLIGRSEIFLEELFPYQAVSKGSAIRSFLPSWVPDWGVLIPQTLAPTTNGDGMAICQETMDGFDARGDVLVVPLQREPSRIERLSGLIPAWPFESLGFGSLVSKVVATLTSNPWSGIYDPGTPCSIHLEFMDAWLAHLMSCNLLVSPPESLGTESAARESADLSWLINRIQPTCRLNEPMRSTYYEPEEHRLRYLMRGYKLKDTTKQHWTELLRLCGLVGELIRCGASTFCLASDSHGELVAVPADAKLGDELLLMSEVVATRENRIRSVAVVGRPLRGGGYDAANAGIARYAKQQFLEPLRISWRTACIFRDLARTTTPRRRRRCSGISSACGGCRGTWDYWRGGELREVPTPKYIRASINTSESQLTIGPELTVSRRKGKGVVGGKTYEDGLREIQIRYVFALTDTEGDADGLHMSSITHCHGWDDCASMMKALTPGSDDLLVCGYDLMLEGKAKPPNLNEHGSSHSTHSAGALRSGG
ncbi:uncharacterized protein PG986_010185 [Apiospora aurea]|uniref:NACHT-NTPase and P-loop NTPases N-terminal domain-containing protein n=1 Tax=Apiospora aurea TaxID=335848 RepID=A0ABR1Q9V6_9PEZI